MKRVLKELVDLTLNLPGDTLEHLFKLLGEDNCTEDHNGHETIYYGLPKLIACRLVCKRWKVLVEQVGDVDILNCPPKYCLWPDEIMECMDVLEITRFVKIKLDKPGQYLRVSQPGNVSLKDYQKLVQKLYGRPGLSLNDHYELLLKYPKRLHVVYLAYRYRNAELEEYTVQITFTDKWELLMIILEQKYCLFEAWKFKFCCKSPRHKNPQKNFFDCIPACKIEQ